MSAAWRSRKLNILMSLGAIPARAPGWRAPCRLPKDRATCPAQGMLTRLSNLWLQSLTRLKNMDLAARTNIFGLIGLLQLQASIG